MSSRPSVLRRSTLAGLLALTAQALPAQTNYTSLDRIEGDWINRNPVPVRPMVLMPSNVDLWAVNTYFSTVNRIDTSLTVVQSFRTLPGPVAIALYQPPTGNTRLLVVCQHVNAVAVHDTVTGDMVDLYRLKAAQPADILVKQASGLAYVSVPGSDQVVEIDLQTAGNPQRVYRVPAKQPTFLSFQGSEVLVAARVSGNGSVVQRTQPPPTVNPEAGPMGILDTLNPAVATTGLPDDDVFWLDRTTGTAVPVVKSAGTLLFAHATKPGTNELWLLNTEANNKNPAKQTEHAIQGEVVFNRVSRILVPNLVPGVMPALPFNIKNLDDSDNNPANGIQYNNATAVGTPYSLVFFPSSGYALAAGLLTSNIALLDPAGNNIYQWTLPAGAMPRQLLLDQTETFVAAWGGDNRVHVYALGTVPPTLLASVSLGFDPTPPAIRDGRRVFFDASHSLHNNASCASCHDEAKTDMLAWNLSNISELVTPNDGKDNKGPMVTQTLVGIAKSMPFHWRGEQLQGLIDFNPAFANLLGGTSLAVGPGSDFEKFAAFILSLTEDANQFQDAGRVLNDNIQPPLPPNSPRGLASNGQTIFTNGCAIGSCHTMPAGTSNDMVADGVLFGNHNIHLQKIDVAAFHGMQFKGMQPLTNVTFNPATGLGTEPYTINGTGLTHAGLINDLNMFLSFFFPLATQPHADAVSFMFQFDTGQAPAVHGATLLNRATAGTAASYIQTYLMTEATINRNCDVVAFGLAQIGTGLTNSAWVLDRSTAQFRREDNVLQPFSFFTGQVANVPGTWFAFAGVPVGTGSGFAIDFDQDQLPNLLECATIPGSQFNKDSDGDGFWDGHEWRNGSNWCNAGSVPVDTTAPRLTPAAPAFQWVSGKTARITFETDELSSCTVVLTPTNPVLPTVTLTSSAPGLQHNLLASTLLMGSTYNGSLIAKDLAGNLTTATLPQIATTGSADAAIVMDNLAWSSPPSGGGGTWSFVATARAALKVNGALPPPGAGVMVVARAMVNGIPATASQYLAGSTPGFDVLNNATTIPPQVPVPYTFLAGPFVISPVPSNALGDVTLSFTLGSNLVTGDKVDLVIESAGVQDLSISSPPTMFNFLPVGGPSSNLPVDFSFPNTPAAFRSIQFVIP